MESAPGHRAGPFRCDRASGATGSAERRGGDRHEFHGWLALIWHHRPGERVCYETIDVSETGARVRTSCSHPEGMTGTAIELLEGDGEPGLGGPPHDDGARITIGRSFIVVWSRAVRRDDGRLDHHEAGIRFI